MSAGVSDQRMKGQGNQVSNGPKDHVNEHEDFDSWRTQHHQGYNTPISTSIASDPYSMSNYYGTSFPYQAFGVGDGTWSNGGDPMTFLGGYGGQMGHDSYGMDGMFGGGGGGFGTAFGQPTPAAAAAAASFNYFHGNGDYSTWGNSAAAMSRKPHYDDYYRGGDGMYGAAAAAAPGVGGSGGGVDGLKAVEQGMQGLGLSDGSGGNGAGVGAGVTSGVKVSDGKDLSKQGQDVVVGKAGGMDVGLVTVQTNVVAPAPAPVPKKMTWATIASQPAKPQPQVTTGGMKKKGPGMPPPPMVPGKHNMDIGTWEGKNGGGGSLGGPNKQPVGPPPPAVRPAWGGPVRGGGPRGGAGGPPGGAGSGGAGYPPAGGPPHHHHPGHHPGQVAILAGPHHPHHPHHPQGGGGAGGGGAPPPHHHMAQQQHPQGPHPGGVMVAAPLPSHPVLDELRVKNNYNPPEFDLIAEGARFFVIKSYSEDDIHRSIKYEIWCSTEHGNKRLDQAFREREAEGGPVFLFFSVNGSGHFCGMAQMVSPVDYHASSSVWSQDKWKGQFRVRWIYVKDVPNVQLRHIRLENNENKPVTNSRDTQEVPFEKGKQVLRVLHMYHHSTSIFDDFVHYEKRQEEEDSRKVVPDVSGPGNGGGGGCPRGGPPQQQGQPPSGGGGPGPGRGGMPPQQKERDGGGRGRGGRGGRN